MVVCAIATEYNGMMAGKKRTTTPRTGITPHTTKGPPVYPVVVEGGKYPSWGQGADGPDPVTGGQAANEDRRYKAAYGIKSMRSPYLHLIAIPPSVAAGDLAAARAVTLRIEDALEIRGRWTKSERARLRTLWEKWYRRGAGLDVMFNLRGWTQTPDRLSTVRGGVERLKQDQQFAQLIDGVRKVMGDE